MKSVDSGWCLATGTLHILFSAALTYEFDPSGISA
eukprot:CAMPEP_0177748160 /NCGR_PEP_ID=MMETSP0484_2-20121128/31785_1 /TAXON_ID=354590 /ORGANISM="Rhodomonas lens, Strain RHODO" /LENGTH=34 /DNA_ID= /DNA_START= /DNA_END= /DNA_ORIENTATION=